MGRGVQHLGRPGATPGRVTLYFATRYAIPLLAFGALAVCGEHDDTPGIAIVLSAQVAFAVATHLLATRGGRSLDLAISAGMTGDAVAVAVLVSLTGGVDGPLTPLFAVQALAAGILLSSRAGLRMLTMSAVAILAVDLTTQSQANAVNPLPPGITAVVDLFILGGAGTLFSAFNERELRRGSAELATIRRITLDIEDTLSLDQIFADLCRGVVEGFAFDAAAVLQRHGAELRCAGAYGVTGLTGHPIDIHGYLASALATPAPVVVPGLQARRDGALISLLGPHGYVAVRLDEDGILVATRKGRRHRPGKVRARELETLSRLAHHARLAVSNARLHERVTEMARTDPLTGLVNHGEMQRLLATELGRVQRFTGMRAQGRYPSMVLLDIDLFKKFNDRFGHQAGDEVLRQVARILRESVRSFDVVARYGGEEFAVILPETDAERARDVAERIRAAISSQPIGVADGGSTRVRVTVSAGVATAPSNGTAPAGLIKSADQALYRSKENGRNRVTHALDDPEPLAPVVNMPPTRRRSEPASRPAPSGARRARGRSSRPTRQTPRA